MTRQILAVFFKRRPVVFECLDQAIGVQHDRVVLADALESHWPHGTDRVDHEAKNGREHHFMNFGIA